MMIISTTMRRPRGGVKQAWGDLPLLLLLLLLACLGPPLAAPELEGHGNMPATNFSCIGKVIGGYYADIYTNCQMFHVCTLNEKGKVHDYTFRCLTGTVFDQETRVCERADEVDCSRSRSFFYLNDDLYGPGIIPFTAHIRVIDEGEARQGTVDPARTIDSITTTTTTPAPQFVHPETSFTCVDKIPGGLYADVETGCAVFHICSVEPNSGVKDNKFVCGPGTLFDQSIRTCQAAAFVDCAAAPSLYYLNDRRNLPDGSSVDLCRSRALGSPLADITSGCRHYTICQAGASGRLVESRLACKKGQLFSQLQKRCVAAKKVQCAKETLSEILGLGLGLGEARESRRRKRRAASFPQSRRFRRAALPPLLNLVITPGIEDTRVRQALYNLAALRQWTLENGRHSIFIELYALQTGGTEKQYQKKAYTDSTLSQDSFGINRGYHQVQRKKRDLVNITVDDHFLFGNQTKFKKMLNTPSQGDLSHIEETEPEKINHDITHSFTGSLLHPTIVTTTIGQKTNTLSTSTVFRLRGSSSTSTTPLIPVTPPPSPVIPTTLSTLTITPTLKTSVTAITVTVTTTKIITSATNIPANLLPTDISSAPPATLSPSSVTTLPSETLSTAAITNAVGNVMSTEIPELTSLNPNVNGGSQNIESKVTEAHTVSSSASPEGSHENTTTPPSMPQEAPDESVTESTNDGVGEPQESPATSEPVTSTITITDDTMKADIISTTKAAQSSEISTTNSTLTITMTPDEMTPESAQNVTTIAPTNVTTALMTVTNVTTDSITTESSTDIIAPSGSINVSTTGAPENTSTPGNVSTTPVTESSVTPQGTLTIDNLPKTNFTCKYKRLEQFYPDPEVNCQVFHYCSAGFIEEQVLDLKFLCTGATMFNLETQKCEDEEIVTCEQDPTTPSPITTNTTGNITAAQNMTTKTPITNVTNPTALTNTTELTTVTTEAYTITSTLDNSTEPSQLNDTTDKETNWNSTIHSHHIHINTTEGKNETTEAPTTTEWTILETTTITEDLQMSVPKDKTLEVDLLESTTVRVIDEPATETEPSIIEVATEQEGRDKITTPTESMQEAQTSTKSSSIQADLEPETSTELGPIMHSEDVAAETKTVTEEVTQVSATDINTTTQGTTTLDPSVSVLHETSTEVSISTYVSVSSSSDSISRQASVSSAVSMSHNTTTPSSVEPLEASV